MNAVKKEMKREAHSIIWEIPKIIRIKASHVPNRHLLVNMK